LYAADEVFTCSTAGGVLPVREVSGRLIANPNGPVTRAIDEAYWAMRAAGEYGTPPGDLVPKRRSRRSAQDFLQSFSSTG
ncbi:MAG: hypothetical protein L7T24_05150, partial [Luminiphilus sp.]|nr:hypothetical protein [Luminiphilus sp.]